MTTFAASRAIEMERHDLHLILGRAATFFGFLP